MRNFKQMKNGSSRNLKTLLIVSLTLIPGIVSASDVPVWVHLVSDQVECGQAQTDFTDIVDGKAELDSAKIRVLHTQRNIQPVHKTADRKCGRPGGFVSCYLIFGEDKQKALQLGFSEGGLCGQPYKARTE